MSDVCGDNVSDEANGVRVQEPGSWILHSVLCILSSAFYILSSPLVPLCPDSLAGDGEAAGRGQGTG